jgi:hypothetical protein
VMRNLEGILQMILAKCEELGEAPSPSPSRGEGS